MKKYIVLYIGTFLSSFSITYSMDQKKPILYEICGMQYTKNNFGDIFPLWQNIPSEQLTEHLSKFVNALKDEVKETPFIIQVPHEKAAALNSIKQVGFAFYHANNDRSEWIFKNNSSIPEPYTANLGAGVIVRKDDTVLIIQEKTRPQFLCPPGGTTDPQELVRTTASRELEEEVGLKVNPDDLKLLAIVNCTNANRFNANDSSYYYTVDYTKVSGNLIPNPNEVTRAFYAPLQDIAMEKPVEGLLIYPAFAAMARHLLNKNAQTHHETLLDYRQISKKDSERNQNDTMTIEFFAQ